MTEGGTLEGRIEAILFVTGDAVKVEELAKALQVSRKDVETALDHLRDEYDFAQRGFTVRRFGSHVQLSTRALYADDIVHMLQPVQKQSLSQSVLETLAVVAYRQPITKAEIESVRGVRCDYSVQVLMHKQMIEEKGRKDALGHPILYGTTDEFLQHFGLATINDLPPMPETAPKEETSGTDEEIGLVP